MDVSPDLHALHDIPQHRVDLHATSVGRAVELQSSVRSALASDQHLHQRLPHDEAVLCDLDPVCDMDGNRRLDLCSLRLAQLLRGVPPKGPHPTK